jgi:hypothetical protein
MSQSTGLHRELIDQFYTNTSVAETCVTVLHRYIPKDLVWIEPSAGTGVFLDIVPGSIGYDIDPQSPSIEKADFLDVEIPIGCVVFGNPPFGRQSSMAKRFIRHAAKRADWIGFILPRSFTKPSMQTAFPLHFHMLESMELPDNAFLVNGVPYNVPCVFQVWKRYTTDRQIVERIPPCGFDYVKKNEPYSFAFRRVGVNAGRCSMPSESLSSQSHYFIQAVDETNISMILHESTMHVFPSNTTGPRSLSKNEATCFLNAVITNALPRR